MQRPIPAAEEEGEVPDVEWWDARLLANGSYEHVEGKPVVNEARITIYVEHPVPLEPPVEAAPPPPMPLMLTQRARTLTLLEKGRSRVF